MNLTDAQLTAIRRGLDIRERRRIFERTYAEDGTYHIGNLIPPIADVHLRLVLDELDRLRVELAKAQERETFYSSVARSNTETVRMS